MFYSHEILTSRKYGVATIWLVATLGQKSSLKKVSRKAILDVDVPKACESILMPEAPMALRLQSNLLYGVSRVYLQQCGYVLSDAQHVQNSIRTLMRVVRTADLDAELSRGRPDQFLLQDDPTFLPDFTMESLDLDLPGFAAPLIRDSQMSVTLSLPSLGDSQRHTAEPGLIIPSDSSAGIGGFEAAGGRGSSRGPGATTLLFRGEEEALLPEADFEFDAEGNIVEITRAPRQGSATPARPSHTRRVRETPHGSEVDDAATRQLVADIPAEPMDLDLPIGDDYDLPEGEHPLPSYAGRPQHAQIAAATQQEESSSIVAPLRRRSRIPKVIPLDTTMELRNRDLTEWNRNYLNNMVEQNRDALKGRATVQAKKNAFEWILGAGLANVGKDAQSVAAPLSVFHGTQLYEMITGLKLYPSGEKRPLEGSGDEMTEERRVRPRSEDGGQVARGAGMDLEDEGARMFTDDVEFPREAVEGPEDISSAMPWNITASSVARQAAGSVASAQRRSRLRSGSPLVGLGRPSTLEPLAPDIGEAFTSDLGFAGDLCGPETAGRDDFDIFGPAADLDIQTAAQHSWQRDILDKESSNFCGFLEQAIGEKQKRIEPGAEPEEDFDPNSIEFEELLPPKNNSRIVAAQALLHVLSLATKNIITATQSEAYGAITLQLVPATA